jgi:hypothetical protein
VGVTAVSGAETFVSSDDGVCGCVAEAGWEAASFAVADPFVSPSAPAVVDGAAGVEGLPCRPDSEVAVLFCFADGGLVWVSGPPAPAEDVALDDGAALA